MDQGHRRIPTGRSRTPPTSFTIAAGQGGFCTAGTSIKDHVLENVGTISNLPSALRSPPGSGIGDNAGNRRGSSRTTRSDAAIAKIFSIETLLERIPSWIQGNPIRWREDPGNSVMAMWTKAIARFQRGVRERPLPVLQSRLAKGGFCATGTSIKDHVLEDVCTISNLPGALRSPPGSGTGSNAGTVGVVRERPAAMPQSRRSWGLKRCWNAFLPTFRTIRSAGVRIPGNSGMGNEDQSHRKIPTGRSRTPPTSFAIAAAQKGGFCATGTSIKDHVLEDVCTISNLPGALRSPPGSGNRQQRWNRQGAYHEGD